MIAIKTLSVAVAGINGALQISPHLIKLFQNVSQKHLALKLSKIQGCFQICISWWEVESALVASVSFSMVGVAHLWIALCVNFSFAGIVKTNFTLSSTTIGRVQLVHSDYTCSKDFTYF